MIRKAGSIALCIALGGCMTFSELYISPGGITTTITRSPDINQVSTAELGDSVATYRLRSTMPGARLIQQSSAQEYVNGMKPIVPAQELTFLGKNGEYNVYSAANCPVAVLGNFGAISMSDMCPLYFQNDPSTEDWRVTTSFNQGSTFQEKQFQMSPPPIIEKFSKEILNEPNFSQELIYNGRIGSSAKFLYREISSGMLRPAFSQEVQYDLGEADIVGFKGARIRVIDATNQSITFELLQPFDGEP